jgi:hypothetical protein
LARDDRGRRSPDEAKRNPGWLYHVRDPDCAALHPGYACCGRDSNDERADMPVSGIVVTKEDVEAFRDSCVLLRSQWSHFQILFEGSDLKREMLQTISPTFFRDLHHLFNEHLVLHICRLTDNAQTMGRKNLTIKFLIEHSNFSAAPATLDKLQRISADIHGFRELILPARNRFIRVQTH